MKRCSDCKKLMDESCFSKDKNRKDGLSYICRLCQSKRQKEYRQSNREILKQKSKDYYKLNKVQILVKTRERNRQYLPIKYLKQTRVLHNLKVNGCAICGYYNRDNSNDYVGALDFHHVNPGDKKFQITTRTLGNKTERLVDEINKCILLCSNCHREIHARGEDGI